MEAKSYKEPTSAFKLKKKAMGSKHTRRKDRRATWIVRRQRPLEANAKAAATMINVTTEVGE